MFKNLLLCSFFFGKKKQENLCKYLFWSVSASAEALSNDCTMFKDCVGY